MYALLLVAESLPETLPQSLGSLESSVDFTWMFIKVILVLGFVCLAAFSVIKYLLPKASFVRRGKNSEIEIVERFSLEPKKNLYILKVGSKFLLLGASDSSLNSLMELDKKDLSSESSQES